MEADPVVASALASAWRDSLSSYAPKVVFAWAGLSAASLFVEPLIMAEGRPPTFSTAFSHVSSSLNPKNLFDVEQRMQMWTRHHSTTIDASKIRRMKLLSKIRKGSAWLMLGMLGGHCILVYNAELHHQQQQKSLGRAPLPLSRIFRSPQHVVVKLLPPKTLGSRLLSGAALDAVLVSASPLQGTSLPTALAQQHQYLLSYFLDRDVAPRLLSKSLVDFYAETTIANQFWMKRVSSSLLNARPSCALGNGRISLHSYDSDDCSTDPLLNASSWLASWGLRPTDNEPIDRHAYHQAVSFAMDLLTALGSLLQSQAPSSSRNSDVRLDHVHVCWQFNSSAKIKNISIHTIHNTSGYLEEQQRRLLQVFYPLFMHPPRPDGGQEERLQRAAEWQKMLLKLAFSGYCQQNLEMEKAAYVMRYQLHSLDGRPLLLNRVMGDLLQLQRQHFPNTVPPSPAPPPALSVRPIVAAAAPATVTAAGVAKAVPAIPSDPEAAPSEPAKPMDWSDSAMIGQMTAEIFAQGTEQVGRAVRNMCCALMELASSYNSLPFFTSGTGRLPATNIEVFVDPESSDMTTILLSALFPLSRSTTVTQYVLQGLYILGVDVQHDWSALHAQQLVPSSSLLPVILPDHDLPTASAKAGNGSKVQMIITLGKDATWLQYRVRTLAQQFPGHPICGVLTCPTHMQNKHEVNNQLPKQAVIVSADDVMEAVWKQF